MRSDLVFGAMKQVSNRFLLAKTAAQATRGFHKPGTRLQDTTNYVLMQIARANPIAQGNAALTAANIPVHVSGRPAAVTHHYRSSNDRAVLESPNSLSAALQRPGSRATA